MGRATARPLSSFPRILKISIHALRGEGDFSNNININVFTLFQSTPSVGRATKLHRTLIGILIFQSTPSVGRATYAPTQKCKPKVIFQSTPSVGRATRLRPRPRVRAKRFQSTPSVGRATSVPRCSDGRGIYFNPRPPWGGRLEVSVLYSSVPNFNPRPPWGGRRRPRMVQCPALPLFQSTPSVGRATARIAQ